MATRRVTRVNQIKTPSGNIESAQVYEGQQVWELAEDIAENTTNREFLAAIDVSALQYCVIQSTVAMTIKTNSSGSPQETITLAANTPKDFPAATLFGGDVNKIYVTSTLAGTLEIYALMNN